MGFRDFSFESERYLISIIRFDLFKCRRYYVGSFDAIIIKRFMFFL